MYGGGAWLFLVITDQRLGRAVSTRSFCRHHYTIKRTRNIDQYFRIVYLYLKNRLEKAQTKKLLARLLPFTELCLNIKWTCACLWWSRDKPVVDISKSNSPLSLVYKQLLTHLVNSPELQECMFLSCLPFYTISRWVTKYTCCRMVTLGWTMAGCWPTVRVRW